MPNSNTFVNHLLDVVCALRSNAQTSGQNPLFLRATDNRPRLSVLGIERSGWVKQGQKKQGQEKQGQEEEMEMGAN